MDVFILLFSYVGWEASTFFYIAIINIMLYLNISRKLVKMQLISSTPLLLLYSSRYWGLLSASFPSIPLLIPNYFLFYIFPNNFPLTLFFGLPLPHRFSTTLISLVFPIISSLFFLPTSINNLNIFFVFILPVVPRLTLKPSFAYLL